MVPSNFPPPPGSARIRPDPTGNPPTGAEKNLRPAPPGSARIRPARRSGIEETRGMGCWMLRLFNMKTPHLGMPKKPGNLYCLFEIEMYISTRAHPKILSSKKKCYGDNWNGDFRYQPRAILLFVSMLMSSNSHRHPQTQTHIGAEFQTKKIFRAKKVLQSKPNPRPQQRLDSRVVQLEEKKTPQAQTHTCTLGTEASGRLEARSREDARRRAAGRWVGTLAGFVPSTKDKELGSKWLKNR